MLVVFNSVVAAGTVVVVEGGSSGTVSMVVDCACVVVVSRLTSGLVDESLPWPQATASKPIAPSTISSL